MKGFAYLEKQEKLSVYEAGKELNRMILTLPTPFSGYHQNAPEEPGENLHILYLVVKPTICSLGDKIIRLNCILRKELEHKFDASLSYIEIFNRETPCVRLFISDLSKLPHVIKTFKDSGFEFEDYKKTDDFTSTIKTLKFVEWEEMAEKIYKANQRDHYYIEIPKKLDWNAFQKIILSIQGSRQFKSFDAAMFSLYGQETVTEYVRIYTRNFEVGDFEKLRDAILKQFIH